MDLFQTGGKNFNYHFQLGEFDVDECTSQDDYWYSETDSLVALTDGTSLTPYASVLRAIKVVKEKIANEALALLEAETVKPSIANPKEKKQMEGVARSPKKNSSFSRSRIGPANAPMGNKSKPLKIKQTTTGEPPSSHKRKANAL